MTDGGLEQLTPLTKLQYLTLTGTQVTDAGAAHLNALGSLARHSRSPIHG